MLIERITDIMADVTIPLLILWIGSILKVWVMREHNRHQDINQLLTALRMLAQNNPTNKLDKSL
jgi:hypothetical protein